MSYVVSNFVFTAFKNHVLTSLICMTRRDHLQHKNLVLGLRGNSSQFLYLYCFESQGRRSQL